MSGRLRKRAEVAVAVAVNSRRRHQRDQALGQLKRRQEQLAVPPGPGFVPLPEVVRVAYPPVAFEVTGGGSTWGSILFNLHGSA